MRRSVPAHPIKRFSLWVVLLGLLFLLFSPFRVHSGPPTDLMTKTALVEIVGKTSDSVIVSERHFMVTPSTQIFGRTGREIPLVLLRPPCEAEITYKLHMDENPECLKIQVKRRLRGSEKPWPPSVPES